MAHILGQLECERLIDREVKRARLSTEEACSLARVGLANYFAGALMMPYGRFLEAAQAAQYDVERLQSRFGASFEQVCHRLSTMQRPGSPGIPFYFVKTDIAGNVLKRSSATRFQFARFGGPCPLWNVYRAFASPGQILVQLATTPDDVTYVNVARTVSRPGGFHLARPRSVAVVLGCEVQYATQTVYAAGLDLNSPQAAVPIGPGCRACERTACRHRAVPPVGHALDVGSGERGVIPYRIRVPQNAPAEGFQASVRT
jgi:predicted transcriptional regulator